MGASRLSIRRKPSTKEIGASERPPMPASSSASTPAKSATNPTPNNPIFSLPKKFGIRSSSRVETKNARSESVGGGSANTEDTTGSSCDALGSEGGSSAMGSKNNETPLVNADQKVNDLNSSNKAKRSVRLSISPDADESESMQVTLAQGSPLRIRRANDNNNEGYSNATEDDCIYTVGSIDYLVKDTSAPSILEFVNIGDTAVEGQKWNEIVSVPKKEDIPNEEEVAAEGGGGEKKKKSSKLGGMFKKSGNKKGAGSGDGGDEKGDRSNDKNDNSSSGGGGGADKNNDEKKDDKDEESNENNNGDNNNNKSSRGPSPTTDFCPQRTQFATLSTLPLHSGPESSAPPNTPSWTPVDGTEFKVRHGPNYPKNGKKAASLTSLYEVYCVRYFRSDKRTVGGATRIMPLPDMPTADVLEENMAGLDINNEEGDAPSEAAEEGKITTTAASTTGVNHYPELDGTKIPDVLVVHFMLPYEPPNMFKQKDDGPGGECVYYLKPSQRFLDEVSGKIPQTPATALFVKWCTECEHDFKMRSRFKCMALVREMEKHNLGLLKNYNGKPVLITESGRVCSGYHGDVRYLEMTANVHYWAFMAKKGFVSLIPKFANMQMEVGFTIEAHSDSEMPECMLGSTVLSYISEKTGPVISPEMQEPVHEHQS